MKLHISLPLLMLVCGSVHAASWSDWWLTPDQQAQRALDAGDAKQAAQLFKDPRSRAFAEIKSGQYTDAAKHLESFNDAQSQYNRGNALARGGDLQAALTAYDMSLKQTESASTLHHDAQHNRDLVEQQLQQQKSSPQNQQSQQNNNSQQQDSHSSEPSQQQAQAQSHTSSQSSEAGQHGSTQPNNTQANGNQDRASQQSSSAQSSTNNQANRQAAEQNGKGQSSSSSSSGNAADKSSAEQAQRDAAAAVKELQNKSSNAKADDKSSKHGDTSTVAETPTPRDSQNTPEDQLTAKPSTEQSLALDQWLRQIPDDPAGLLRRKFMIEHMLKQKGAQP